MELASFGANFSSIFEHLQLVVILLFCLPAISFTSYQVLDCMPLQKDTTHHKLVCPRRSRFRSGMHALQTST